jgi:hypothetical protein
LFLSYLYIQGFFWGYVLHGRPRVYTYIPDSLRSFVSIDEFSRLLGNSGYDRVNARGFLLGGIGLHWAAKAEPNRGATAGGRVSATGCVTAETQTFQPVA